MTGRFRHVGQFCHRYGPGRLPRADERAIGAGYAAASAALVAALLFAGTSSLASVFFGVELTSGLAPYGLAAIPLVVPGAFVAGWATWRQLPETTYFGPIAGTIAVAVTYPVAAALLLPVLVVELLLSGTPLDALGTGLVLGPLIAGFAFVLTSWLTLPLGAASGYVYERARTATDVETGG
jgi:hypothetical protein